MNTRDKARDKHSEYLNGDKIECLICGKSFKSVGNHVFMAHGITAREYKVQFGISTSAGLLGDKTRAAHKEYSIDNKHKAKLADIRVDEFGSVADYVLARKCEYIPIIKESARRGVSLYSIYKATNKIIEFIKKYGSNSEKELLRKSLAFTTTQNPKVTVKCECCGKAIEKFHSELVKTKSPTCSYECARKIKVNRVQVKCVICGTPMLLTPSNVPRIKTCSKKCQAIKRTKT